MGENNTSRNEPLETTSVESAEAEHGTAARDEARCQAMAAFMAEVLSEHRSKLLCIALGRTSNWHDAEEIVQEACMKALVWSRNHGKTPDSPGFLYNGLKNCLADRGRRNASVRKGLGVPVDICDVPLAHFETPRHAAEQVEVRECIAEALPPRQYDALVDTELCGYTSADIAEPYGVDASRIRHDKAEAIAVLSGEDSALHDYR